MQKEIHRSDIVPNGWKPTITPPENHDRERLLALERECEPFGHWSIWQRNHETKVGPDMFSFLFFAGEMSAIYQGLYCRLSIAPKILAIIQPGGAMGGAWECVTDNNSFFKSIVKSNPAGMPEYLLYGGIGISSYYEEPCWNEYEGERLFRLPERYAGLWKLKKSHNANK